MRTARAAAGSLVFLVLAPGVVAGLVPWWLTGWRVEGAPLPIRIAGAIVLVAGVGALLHAFARFVVEGVGTPAPVGKEYEAYRRAVPGWWPRWRR